MSQSVSEMLRAGAKYLKSRGLQDASESSEGLLSHILQKSRSSLYADFDETISKERKTKFFDLIKRRANRFPLQYLIGQVPFRYANLKIDEGTFIPRPETECLVDVVLERLRGEKLENPKILDIGTGSGCLAISLALEIPNARVVATDSSARSLSLAQQNAARNGVRKKIKFVRTRYWEGLSEKFDIVVSNPPYLSKHDFLSLQPEIRFEPKRALDGGWDGLCAYQYMAGAVRAILKRFGAVVFEVGAAQALLVEKVLGQNGFEDIQRTKDLAGIERIVSARIR